MRAGGKRSTSTLLLVGDGLSAFGTWIDFIAILTLSAYQYQVSSVEMAIVSAAMLLPGILLAPTIGRLCDEKDPKRLLLLSIVMRVVCTAGVLLLHDFTLFLLLIASRSVFAGVAPPAINVTANRSIEPGALPRFYSVLNVLNSAAKIIAPAMGTISSSLSSEAFALVMSAVFSAASFFAFSLVVVESQTDAAEAQDDGSAKAPDADSGLAAMLPLLWIAGAYAFSVFMVNSLVPVVLQRAGFDKSLLGILISCSGAGNILSGMWLAKQSGAGRVSPLCGRPAESILPALLQAAGFAAIAFVLWAAVPHKAYVLPVIFFAIGTVSARFAIALNVFLATHHAQSIGTASGAMQSTQNTMILIAPMLGAMVLDASGGAALFAVAAGSALLLFSLFAAVPLVGRVVLRQSKA